jgi:hypothetical protein
MALVEVESWPLSAVRDGQPLQRFGTVQAGFTRTLHLLGET